MAPKKRPATTPKKKPATPPTVMFLSEAALADLKYLEPARTRQRVTSCLNELFGRVLALEHLHEQPTNAEPQPPR